ncbi:DUF4123 domain-containing protein [Litoreibacter janthinus]|uniref:DUF4123 domain-containing protein n=1 Tax=Litoreibacter janthinus TaxID=670154 RepID=A0A1I6HQP7_9RHOB|nr:DUF4123 domain-containing protein [Litoreibacter janthinus]SFR56773.1 protein of unknown function [Litoreibacter janthinus]
MNTVDDIWTGTSASNPAAHDSAAAQAGSLILSQTFESIEPLDAQFGVDVKKSVPDALTEELFGQPAPSPADLAAANGDADKVPPLGTYAVLDAAVVTNLPELLETSGLEHLCLFIGEAQEELSHVAPWIVRLETGNALTRHLFTKGNAPWQLWDKRPGMFLRARASCSEMRKHFRKILKVQNDNGKWFYFRFWEGTALLTVAEAAAQKDQARLYRPGMIAYARQSSPDGDVLVKSWLGDPRCAPTP